MYQLLAQFGSIRKLTESTLYTITQAASEDIKQYCAQYQALPWVINCQLSFVLQNTPIEVNGPATLLPTYMLYIVASLAIRILIEIISKPF